MRRRLVFLSDVRRMNVALTRARRGLVVFASASTLHGKDVRYHSRPRVDAGYDSQTAWERWIAWMETAGAVVSGVEVAIVAEHDNKETSKPNATSSPTEGLAANDTPCNALSLRCESMLLHAVRTVVEQHQKPNLMENLEFALQQLRARGICSAALLLRAIAADSDDNWNKTGLHPLLLQELRRNTGMQHSETSWHPATKLPSVPFEAVVVRSYEPLAEKHARLDMDQRLRVTRVQNSPPACGCQVLPSGPWACAVPAWAALETGHFARWFPLSCVKVNVAVAMPSTTL